MEISKRRSNENMADEKELEVKDSVSDYATHVMSFSLVTGVSNIVTTKSNLRKFFKASVLCLCICGFLYQATEFIQFILTYPSVVDIQVYIPDEYIAPAYTFCNYNGIKRSKFCAKYPNRCYTPENETFCQDYKEFCSAFEDTSNLTVVKPEEYEFEKNVTFEELKELNGGFQELTTMKFSEFNEYSNTTEKELVTGPIPVRRDDGVLVLCYSLHLRHNSSLNPRMKYKPDKFSKVIDTFAFDLQPQEVFRPYRQPSAFFNLHSPFFFENPVQLGVLLRPNREYMFYVRMEEEQLLPYPYPSDCTNYTQLWLDRNKSGPRNQESCVEFCELMVTLKDCNCTYPEVFYPTDAPYCTDAYKWCSDESLIDEFIHENEECEKNCKDDCNKRKFRYFAQSRDLEKDTKRARKMDSTTTVKSIAYDPEIVKLHYRPQHQDLEVFSYIGGYIGAWLGISFVAIADLFESLALIGAYFFKKKRTIRNHEDKERPVTSSADGELKQ